MSDKIVKTIEVKADRSRVWRALTDYREFGEWFRVKLNGPFVVGEVTTGKITYEGYEHLDWNGLVTAIEPEDRFVFQWHPYPVDTGRDFSSEPQTQVEFVLESIPGGTRVRVTESGFDKLPEDRRAEAFRCNEGGWAVQMQNISEYVATQP